MFEYVILVLWGDLLGSDSLQFGYRSGTSTSQCSWLVTEVVGYYLRRGTAVSACLLDCSKAFDKCRFDHIFEKLLQKSVPPIVVRVLICMYEEQAGFVKLGGNKSNCFRITNGTRQGSVLSPAIFSVYLDDLLKELREKGLGCHIGGWWFGICGFADKLILLASVRLSCRRWRVSVCSPQIRIPQDQRPSVYSSVAGLTMWSILHQFCWMVKSYPGFNLQSTWVTPCTRWPTWTLTVR